MTDPAAGAALRDGRYAWYVTGLLTLVYAVAFIDRQVLNLLVEPIKGDLGLSDTQVSLLQGLAFMGAYIAMGPFFGRWADQGSRRNLLMFGAVLWSVATAACGLVESYWGLFLARAAVGGAEACIIPAAWSLLSDYFSRERLPRAMSVFLMGPYVGGGLALIFGGLVIAWVAASPGLLATLGAAGAWQAVFVIVGLPGVLIALALVTVREPPRIAASGSRPDERRFTLRDVLAFVWAGRAFYLRFYVGMALIVIVLYALPAWMPAYLIRAHGAAAADVGLRYGALVLACGTLGVLSGPWLGRWLARRGYDDMPVRTAAIAAAGLIPACALLPFAPGYAAALACAAVATVFYSLPQAMAATALQVAAPNRMRGLVSSLYVFLVSVTGLGVAPTLIALVTDHVLRDPARVGESIGLVCGGAAAAALYLIWSALPHYRESVARAQAAEQA